MHDWKVEIHVWLAVRTARSPGSGKAKEGLTTGDGYILTFSIIYPTFITVRSVGVRQCLDHCQLQAEAEALKSVITIYIPRIVLIGILLE